MKFDASYDDSRAEEALADADARYPKRRKPAQRHGTSQESTLPFWTTWPGDKRGTLNIICPRCNGKAIVSRKWLTSMPQIGRSCTYCFKTNRIPEVTS